MAWVVKALGRALQMRSRPNNNRIRQQQVARVSRHSKALPSATQMHFLRTTTMEEQIARRQGRNSLVLGPTLTLIMAMEEARGTREQADAQITEVTVTATLI